MSRSSTNSNLPFKLCMKCDRSDVLINYLLLSLISTRFAQVKYPMDYGCCMIIFFTYNNVDRIGVEIKLCLLQFIIKILKLSGSTVKSVALSFRFIKYVENCCSMKKHSYCMTLVIKLYVFGVNT